MAGVVLYQPLAFLLRRMNERKLNYLSVQQEKETRVFYQGCYILALLVPPTINSCGQALTFVLWRPESLGSVCNSPESVYLRLPYSR